MNIKETTNPKYLIVTEPTDEALTAAKNLARGNWAKIQGEKIIIHKNFRDRFETMIRVDNRNATVAPQFETYAERDAWLAANFNSFKAVSHYEKLHPQVWNREYAGQTVADLEAYALSD